MNRVVLQTLPQAALVFLLGLFFQGCGAQVSTDLMAFTEPLPPLSMEVGAEVTGFSSELLDMMAQEAGVGVQKQVLPWTRAYERARMLPNGVLYSLVRTPEREALFRWVGPISARRIVLYKWADRTDIRLKTLDDARPYRIGTVRESASTRALQQQGFPLDFPPATDSKYPNGGLELGATDEMNMNKFIAKRFDLLLALDWSAAYNLKKAGKEPSSVVPALVVDDAESYWYGLNPAGDPELAKRLELALQRIKADGRYAQLSQKYLMKGNVR